VRPERPGERAAVIAVHRVAFGPRGDVVADLVVDLLTTSPHGALSLVAERRGSLIGHVLLTPALLEAPERRVDVRVLSPLAVAPDARRRGVGSALVRSALERLDDDGVPAVFLEGDPAYYARFGFLAAGPLGFRKPSPRIPDEAFQVARLGSYAPWMTGTLVYSESFWRHDAVGPR